MSETKQKPKTEDEPDTFAELAERIAVVTSPYEQLYQYKGIEPTGVALALAKLQQPLLYEIGDPFDPNCARTHWEKYRKKAIELGATANELPTKTNYPFYDLIQLGKFCSARASRQKKDEDESKVVRFTFKPPPGAFPNNGKAGDIKNQKPRETGGNVKRIVAAIVISFAIILFFELSVYFGPVTLVKNHPRSYGIQGSVICLIPCLVFGFFKPRWRKWWWGAVIAFLAGLLNLL